MANPTRTDVLLGHGCCNIPPGIGNSLATQSCDDHVWQVDDSVIDTKGRHSIKTGFQFWHEPIRTFYSVNNGELGLMNFKGTFTADKALNATTNTGDGSADFFLGLPGEFGRGVSTGRIWEQVSN